MNPILNQLIIAPLSNIMNIFRSVKNAQNPNLMMQSLVQSNPQIKQVMDFISQNGGNAKQVFYAAAQQKGVDPNTIINQLQNIN